MKTAKRRPPSRKMDVDGFASREGAQALALRALAFLARDVERIGRFLALTGVAPDDLRHLAQAPDFLLAVLDHLAADEPLLLAFVAEEGVAPEAVGLARRALGGGEDG
jgi:hypothetical protein